MAAAATKIVVCPPQIIRDNKSRPFFCYVPFHIVHAPLQAKDADLKDVDPKVTDATKRTYAAMVQALDKNVGAILAELDQLWDEAKRADR